jgi:hypothetical protein
MTETEEGLALEEHHAAEPAASSSEIAVGTPLEE